MFKSIMQFLGPIGVFILGMLGTLGMTIFFPAIDIASSAIPTATSNISRYPFLQAEVTSTRLIIFVLCLGGTVAMTFYSWWLRR